MRIEWSKHLLFPRVFKIRWGVGASTTAILLACSFCTTRAAEPEVAPVVITLTSDGRILFRGEVVPLDRLDATLRAAGIPPGPVALRADEKVPYAKVMRVLDFLSDQQGHSSYLDAPGPGYRERRKISHGDLSE